jgi:hypothetical protein
MMELRREMGEMRSELRLARTAPPPPPPASMPEEAERDMMVKVGTMMNARLEALEDRLLPSKEGRPVLASDKIVAAPGRQNSAEPKRRPRAIVATASTGPKANDYPPNTEERKKKNKKKRKTMAAAEAAEVSASRAGNPKAPNLLPLAPQPQKSPWNAADGKGGKSRKATKGTTPARSEARKLRPPRSAAVVLTLQPEAEARGVTYAKVLAEAKEKVNLADLGIANLRFRRAVTGARVLELPGATSGEKADKLAKELAEKLGEGVRISRPTRCAELRLSNLDDSVTPAEVVAAVARAGGCAEDQVKTGEIRPDHSGLGTLWVRCPVTAAKKVAENGRFLVGWSSAQVKLLESRTMRCFRCLESGHVRVQCQSQTDRSDLCYRCGQPGHKSAQCTAAPLCVLCKAVDKSADHVLGSKSCSAPRQRGIKSLGDGPRASSQRSQPALTTPEARNEAVEGMAVD